MKNFVLITSVINTPQKPLSYCKTRSIYSREERFLQLKQTISSIREKIIDVFIFLVECTELTDEENDFLNMNCDHVMNLWKEDPSLQCNIFSLSKSLGEGSMTIKCLDYIIKNNITFENFFKISGRYYLNDNFNYNNIISYPNVVVKIQNDPDNINTSLYKLSFNHILEFKQFLLNSIVRMIKCEGYEVIFASFVNTLNELTYFEKIGVSGLIAVSGDIINT